MSSVLSDQLDHFWVVDEASPANRGADHETRARVAEHHVQVVCGLLDGSLDIDGFLAGIMAV